MDQLKDILIYLLTPSTPIFLVGGLIVLLVPILVHVFVQQTTPYTTLPSILLAGPPGGGKTALLTLLERGDARPVPTHTSQAPQAIELTVSDDAGKPLPYRLAARDDAPGTHRKFLLLDTPGHGKLRAQHALAYIEAAGKNKNKGSGKKKGSKDEGKLQGIVFVVDAAALDESSEKPGGADGGMAAAAEYLYEVLLALQRRTGSGRTSKAPRAVHVLIAANKTDLFTALPASLVRSGLEAELGRIRRSRSQGLLDSGAGADDVAGDQDEEDSWLGAYGSEKFAFGQMREFDVEVDVVGGSVLEGKVDKWWDWISQRI